MTRAQDFIRHAENCEALAARTAEPEHRAQIARLAELWRQLAERRAALDGKEAASIRPG